jgi:Trk-type K+ transport system membrane component
LLRVQCGKAKRGAGGGILLPVFILWEPFRYPFTWLPILALRPSTKAPPATTISNPVSISLLFSRIYLFGNPFVFFPFIFFFWFGTPELQFEANEEEEKNKRRAHEKKKRLAHTTRVTRVCFTAVGGLCGLCMCLHKLLHR